MTDADSPGTLSTWYERRIGEPTTGDEVNGYWLFVFGVLLGVAGVALFFLTTAATVPRGIAYALAALAPPFIMLGAVIRFPLRQPATYLGYLGLLISVAAVVWFVSVFPGGWLTASGDPSVIALYAVGLVLVGLAGTVVPLLTDPVRREHASMEEETERLRGEAAAREAELEEQHERIADLEAELEAREAELESLRGSQARFELYEDRGGRWRWRLRHRNGNVIADSGQGYSSRQSCRRGMASVRRNALGAGILRVVPDANAEARGDAEPEPEDVDDPSVAVPTAAATVESRATFEAYEDAGGEWRWRLVYENGNVLADSGEGYVSRSNVRRAMDRVREQVAVADYLRIDPAAYEIYRDRGGEWRWRLVHKNGNVLADSGEGYASRSGARNGVESVRANVADAAVEEQ